MTHDGVAVLTVGFDVLLVFGRRLMPANGHKRTLIGLEQTESADPPERSYPGR